MRIPASENIGKINLNLSQAREQQPKLNPDKSLKINSGNESKQKNVVLSEEKLEDLVKAANEVMEVMDKRLQFSVHEGTNRVMVKIIDRNDGKVIKEIPPEKMLDLVAKMWEVVGLLIDDRV